MKIKKQCIHCGKTGLHHGKHQNYIKCLVCNAIVCDICSRKGFCHDHFFKLTSEQKDKINKLIIIRILFFTFIFIAFMTIFIIFLVKSVKDPSIDPLDVQIGVYIGLLIMCGLFFAEYLYRRKICNKILDPLRHSEGFPTKKWPSLRFK